MSWRKTNFMDIIDGEGYIKKGEDGTFTVITITNSSVLANYYYTVFTMKLEDLSEYDIDSAIWGFHTPLEELKETYKADNDWEFIIAEMVARNNHQDIFPYTYLSDLKSHLKKEYGLDLPTRRALSWKNFREILQFIEENHKFGTGGKSIKYVEPMIDVRTNDIFKVSLRGNDGDHTFDIINENKDKDLTDEVMKYLNENPTDY